MKLLYVAILTAIPSWSLYEEPVKPEPVVIPYCQTTAPSGRFWFLPCADVDRYEYT